MTGSSLCSPRAGLPERAVPVGPSDVCDAHYADTLGSVVEFERDVDAIDHP